MHDRNYQREFLKQRYRKVNTIARYLFIFLTVLAISILFLPPWIIKIFRKIPRTPEEIEGYEKTLFDQYGFEALGFAMLIILIIFLLYLVFSRWASLRQYR